MKNFTALTGIPTASIDCNSCVVSIGGINLWFSYKTLIAFSVPGRLVVHQNDWSTTTGKHLNAIDGGGKKSRVNDEKFKQLYDELVGKMFK